MTYDISYFTMVESGEKYGLPTWVQVDPDLSEGRLFLRNVTRAQAEQFADDLGLQLDVGSGEVYQNSGDILKRAVLIAPGSQWLKIYAAEDKSPDSYAAYGSAMNIGKEAFYNMESAGWQAVLPDEEVLQARLNAGSVPITLSQGLQESLASGSFEDVDYTTPNPSMVDGKQIIPPNRTSKLPLLLLAGAGALAWYVGRKKK